MIDKWISVPMARQFERANWTVRIIIGLMMVIVGFAIRSEPPTRGTVLIIEQHALFGVVNVAILGILLIIGGTACLLLRRPRPYVLWLVTTPYDIYAGYTLFGWAIGDLPAQGATIYLAFSAIKLLVLFMWSMYRYEQHRD